MGTDVKICGLKTAGAVEAAIEAGASHFGMVFFPKSPRNITLSQAGDLAALGRGRILSVALVVDADDDLIEDIASQVRPDMLQLHGHETPEKTHEIRRDTGLPVIKAISVGKSGDTNKAHAYRDAADLILFDAKPPADKDIALPGGNGLAFDWHLLEPVRSTMKFMLSGGLTPENVRDAIGLTGAALVDVSSGVETAPGEKDPVLIRRFVEAAHSAAMEEIANG